MNETVDPDSRDRWGRTPLSHATGMDYERNHNLLHKYNGVVRKLLADARVDPNSRDNGGNTPLYYATKNGDMSLVKTILEHPRTDLGFGEKWTLLAVAAREGHADVVKAFLKMGIFDVNALTANPDEYLRRTLLSLAAGGGHLGVVDLLLSQPGIEAHKRDGEGRTPLAMAAWEGHAVIVERLLAVEGADPNSRDIRGWTPLRMAVAADRSPRGVDAIEVLLRAERIDLDVADTEGRTPLSVVCENVNLELVNLLLASDGVDPDSRDTAGRSPLSWIVAPATSPYDKSFRAIDRRKEIMRRLLQIQAVDPNAEDVEGLTPLIRAIQGEYGNELVRVLLEREDLDVHQRSRDGRTPMALARKRGDAAVVSLLCKRGASDGGNELPVTVGNSEYSSSDDDLNMEENRRLSRKRGGSVVLRAGLNRRCSSSSPESSRSLVFGKGVRNSISSYDVEHQLARNILLPLGAQQEHLDLVEGNDADLCAKCKAIDLDEAFSAREARGRRVIAELGRIDGTWKARECPMCRLIAAASPCWRVAIEGNIEEDDDGQFDLVAFSSTGVWLCHDQLDLWQHFTRRWIDTMLLGVVPRLKPGASWTRRAANSLLRSGFIGRLGSNCEHRTHAISIARVEDGVDFAAAKGWIACCREEHSIGCNPRTLARVSHFRLIDCATRRIVQPSDQVPPYVALSYVWGAPLATDLGEKSKLKYGDSDLPRDGLDIGESVEAVVEDSIHVALGLGYGFLWVDKYCILQEGDDEMKEAQLQNMDLVYANAEVTLVATARQASFSGLPGVSSRCPRVSQPSVRLKGHAVTLIPPDPAYQVQSSAWMTRGWTYQEGLLSRRRLFFSESEMSFECRDLLAREAIRIPPGVEQQMGHLGKRLMPLSWVYRQLGVAALDQGNVNLFDRLAEYTRRKLTYQSDVLNAMLGILQVYATFERSPVYHVCGVPILHDSGNRFSRSAGSNDGGSDNAGVALAGFVGGLCWTLRSPGVRRSGFPSWSWTGWHGVVNSRFGEPASVKFANGFDVEVSVVLAEGIAPMPWTDYYNRLKSAAAKKSWFRPLSSQHHMLDITANIIVARFYERQNILSNIEWKGTVCIGDDVWSGEFALTQKESPSSSGDIEAGFVPSLRRRLLEESWLGIVLGQSLDSGNRGDRVYVLVVEEMPPSGTDATTHWERVGLLIINYSTLKGEMLERRKLRLA